MHEYSLCADLINHAHPWNSHRPLFYHPRSGDVLIVLVDPIARDKLPASAEEIRYCVNEITFNSSLLKVRRRPRGKPPDGH